MTFLSTFEGNKCLNGQHVELNIGSVVQEAEMLFHMGDSLQGFYLVNSGAVKLFTVTEAGEQHVVRFCLPGDVFGLDALDDGRSRTSAIVLEIANVSFIPLNQFLKPAAGVDIAPLIRKIGRVIRQEREHSLMLSHCSARRRLAWFLLEHSSRQADRGLAAQEFDLPMLRGDLALYLGLAVETVSRELARFSKLGLLQKKLRHIKILDQDGLLAIREGLPSCELNSNAQKELSRLH